MKLYCGVEGLFLTRPFNHRIWPGWSGHVRTSALTHQSCFVDVKFEDSRNPKSTTSHCPRIAAGSWPTKAILFDALALGNEGLPLLWLHLSLHGPARLGRSLLKKQNAMPARSPQARGSNPNPKLDTTMQSRPPEVRPSCAEEWGPGFAFSFRFFASCLAQTRCCDPV